MTKVIDYLFSIGVDYIAGRILDLGEYCIGCARKRGIPIQGPVDRERMSGIINLAPEGDKKAICQKLAKKGIITQPRGAGIRVALNYYNTEEEIDRLFGAL